MKRCCIPEKSMLHYTQGGGRMRNDQALNYATIAREYFKYKKVYRYRMKKISDMTDAEVIEKCHFWQEENNMVEDYWNFVGLKKN